MLDWLLFRDLIVLITSARVYYTFRFFYCFSRPWGCRSFSVLRRGARDFKKKKIPYMVLPISFSLYFCRNKDIQYTSVYDYPPVLWSCLNLDYILLLHVVLTGFGTLLGGSRWRECLPATVGHVRRPWKRPAFRLRKVNEKSVVCLKIKPTEQGNWVFTCCTLIKTKDSVHSCSSIWFLNYPCLGRVSLYKDLSRIKCQKKKKHSADILRLTTLMCTSHWRLFPFKYRAIFL